MVRFCDEWREKTISEGKTDVCSEGMVTDILDILGKKLGSFAGDELIILLKLVANR
jgi:hypothetical protein